MPRICITCGRLEVFLVHPADSANGRRISNLRQGSQGPVCGYCYFGPEITLEKRLKMSLEVGEAMKHIQEVSK